MRRFYVQRPQKFRFLSIKRMTQKAILYEIEKDILIWVPRSWVFKFNNKEKWFSVKEQLAFEIEMKIKAEKNELL